MTEPRITPDLPERLASLYDYRTEKFETPLNDIGIADIDLIFELAIRTYPGNLDDLKLSLHDRHHMYWTEQSWKDLAESQKNEEDRHTVNNFRNSAPQIAYVPRLIHEWIEASQIPPPVPSIEVMRKRNLAWQSASLLLSSADALDKARTEYDKNKGRSRIVLSYIPGITTKTSRLSDRPLEPIEVTDSEYSFSELEERLKSWKYIVQEIGSLSLGQGILQTSRLYDVRTLRRRVRAKENAFVPYIPNTIAS